MACDTPMTPLKPSYLKAPHQWAKGAKRRHCHMQQLRTPERLLQAPNIAANAVGERPRPARRGMRARAPAAGAGACASFMLPLACAPPSPLSASRLMSSSRSSAPSASCTENCAAGVCSDRFCACGRAAHGARASVAQRAQATPLFSMCTQATAPVQRAGALQPVSLGQTKKRLIESSLSFPSIASLVLYVHQCNHKSPTEEYPSLSAQKPDGKRCT